MFRIPWLESGKSPLFFVPATAALLCFLMGLQNAIITKISKAEIRTTHMTGLVTDMGIELGKLLYWNVHARSLGAVDVKADRPKLALLASLLGVFLIGGLIGALGFKHVGFVSAIPLAVMLMVLAAVPLADDLVSQRSP